MKKTLLATTAFLAVIGSTMAASAAPYHNRVTPRERAVIAQSHAHLNAVTRAARADGRITVFERARIKMAQYKLNRAVANARKY
jgi:hypothetical protein